MSFKCTLGDQELLSIDFDARGWEDLRARNRKDRALKMRCCGAEVILRQTKLGTQYFAHAKKGTCATATDTAEVMLAREVIAKAVRRAGWSISVEAAGTSTGEEEWTVDVLARREGRKPVAFKVQWGRLPLEEVSHYQAVLHASGIRTLWFMRQQSVAVEKATPTFRISHHTESKTCVVSLPGPYYHPAFATSKNSEGPNYWRQHIELDRFVEGALGGKLRFAPQVDRTLPLDVCAAYTDCWRCKKTTGLVIDLCFAASRVLQGTSDVTAKIYDFDDDGRGATLLMSTLPAALLASHGIGPIKPRYSRTEGQRYLSNGCIHCDALQGRFFDHEVAYDAHPIFSIDVLFDDRWVSHLEDREAIDRWWFDDRPGETAADDVPQS
jgi:competence protein CoiA